MNMKLKKKNCYQQKPRQSNNLKNFNKRTKHFLITINATLLLLLLFICIFKIKSIDGYNTTHNDNITHNSQNISKMEMESVDIQWIKFLKNKSYIINDDDDDESIPLNNKKRITNKIDSMTTINPLKILNSSSAPSSSALPITKVTKSIIILKNSTKSIALNVTSSYKNNTNNICNTYEKYADSYLANNNLTDQNNNNNNMNMNNNYNNNYIEKLDFSNRSIETLKYITFGIILNLNYLNLSHNNIIEFTFHNENHMIQTNFTECQPPQNNHLQTLDLSHNHLTNVKRINLKNLNALTFIDLSANEIQQIPMDLFSHTTNLRTLNLSSNFLTQLYKRNFYNLINIETIILSNNNIEFIELDTFIYLPNLSHVNLALNSLSIQSIHSLQGVPNLEALSIAYNLRNELIGPALQGFIASWSLKYLDASGTGLCTIPAALTQSVHALILADNHFQVIRCGDLDSYPLLQYLDLSSTHLIDIEDDALGRLEILITLHLEYNELLDVPDSLPSSLKYLYLQYNKITELKPLAFQVLHRLEYLNLSGNKLIYIPKLPLPNLLILNVRNATIRSINKSIRKTSPMLKSILLEYNPRACWDLFDRLTWITFCSSFTNFSSSKTVVSSFNNGNPRESMLNDNDDDQCYINYFMYQDTAFRNAIDKYNYKNNRKLFYLQKNALQLNLTKMFHELCKDEIQQIQNSSYDNSFAIANITNNDNFTNNNNKINSKSFENITYIKIDNKNDVTTENNQLNDEKTIQLTRDIKENLSIKHHFNISNEEKSFSLKQLLLNNSKKIQEDNEIDSKHLSTITIKISTTTTTIEPPTIQEKSNKTKLTASQLITDDNKKIVIENIEKEKENDKIDIRFKKVNVKIDQSDKLDNLPDSLTNQMMMMMKMMPITTKENKTNNNNNNNKDNNNRLFLQQQNNKNILINDKLSEKLVNKTSMATKTITEFPPTTTTTVLHYIKTHNESIQQKKLPSHHNQSKQQQQPMESISKKTIINWYENKAINHQYNKDNNKKYLMEKHGNNKAIFFNNNNKSTNIPIENLTIENKSIINNKSTTSSITSSSSSIEKYLISISTTTLKTPQNIKNLTEMNSTNVTSIITNNSNNNRLSAAEHWNDLRTEKNLYPNLLIAIIGLSIGIVLSIGLIHIYRCRWPSSSSSILTTTNNNSNSNDLENNDNAINNYIDNDEDDDDNDDEYNSLNYWQCHRLPKETKKRKELQQKQILKYRENQISNRYDKKNYNTKRNDCIFNNNDDDDHQIQYQTYNDDLLPLEMVYSSSSTSSSASASASSSITSTFLNLSSDTTSFTINKQNKQNNVNNNNNNNNNNEIKKIPPPLDLW